MSEEKSEEPRIEPYYRGQAKQLIDTLFDLGLLSASMSRGGIDGVEDLVALYFQQIADSARRCAGFTKKYKKIGEEHERKRHEEEKLWITRAKESEALVAELSITVGEQKAEIEHRNARDEKADAAWAWSKDIGEFLRRIIDPDAAKRLPALQLRARVLLRRGFDGKILEPETKPGKIIDELRQIRQSDDGCVCPPEPVYPGMVIPKFCRKCGGRVVNPEPIPMKSFVRCASIHDFNQCQLTSGHDGCHHHVNGSHIEEW